MSSFSLEKNRFRSNDLTCWQSTNHCVYDSKLPWIRALERFSGPRVTAVILKILHPLKYPGLTVMSSKSKKKIIHNYLPCLLAEMAKVASSVARSRKCYINRLERFICMGYWPSVRSRWLDIGQVPFYACLRTETKSRGLFDNIHWAWGE